MSAVRVGIYGASGYAGMDLVEILARHPHVRLVFATSSTYAGEPVPGSDLRYIKPDEAKLDSVDAVFLALPHKASAPVAARALKAGVKVIDLSADLRLDTPGVRIPVQDAPQPGGAPAPYGLPEINRDKLRGIDLVAAPGCYPTTTLLGLYPVLKTHVLAEGAPIIVDAKSGVSGAGREPKPNTHFVEVYGNLSPYNTGRSHRHVARSNRKSTSSTGTSVRLSSHRLLPVDRGLMASIYVTLKDTFGSDQAQSLYEEVYGQEPLVKVLPPGQHATLKHVVKTNTCAISLTPVTERYLHVTSVTDNLRKGASGQAAQCFNLMFGFLETTALL
jgi:N-acetyl-gamma-glutamyl-phosphate reductase